MINSDIDKMTPHRLEACKQLTPTGARLFKYIEFDDDEELLAEVHKHPIGLVFTWLTGGLITATIALVSIFLASQTDTAAVSLESAGSGNSTLRAIILLVGLLLGLTSLVITIITAILYESSRVFLTNEKMAEVIYVSILNRRVTQLGIGNVEDVTVQQKGILPRIFHYGNLLVETAGETKAPDFTYVPNPNAVAQIIVKSHEAYVEKFGN